MKAENKGAPPRLGKGDCAEERILAEVGKVMRSWLGEEGGALPREQHMLGWSRSSRS